MLYIYKTPRRHMYHACFFGKHHVGVPRNIVLKWLAMLNDCTKEHHEKLPRNTAHFKLTPKTHHFQAS